MRHLWPPHHPLLPVLQLHKLRTSFTPFRSHGKISEPFSGQVLWTSAPGGEPLSSHRNTTTNFSQPLQREQQQPSPRGAEGRAAEHCGRGANDTESTGGQLVGNTKGQRERERERGMKLEFKGAFTLTRALAF